MKYFLEIDENFYKDGMITNKYKEIPIYILSYPISIEITHSPGVIKSYQDNKIYHWCKTSEGSSGGPILNLDNHKVIGIHLGFRTKSNLNCGTIINFPKEDLIII